jgi:hypothetical protein
MQRRTFLNGLAGLGAVYSMSALNPPQYIPFEDYDHLARWDCVQFGRQILRAASAPAKKA